jgi:hypothetical protein
MSKITKLGYEFLRMHFFQISLTNSDWDGAKHVSFLTIFMWEKIYALHHPKCHRLLWMEQLQINSYDIFSLIIIFLLEGNLLKPGNPYCGLTN